MKNISQFFDVNLNIDNRFVAVLIIFLFNGIVKGQTTFTATEVMVTNSITAGGAIRGQCITANDTLRAKDDVVAEQDLKVAGDINVNGNINAGPTSIANLGAINASQNIKTQGAFIFNSPTNSSNPLGLKVFGSSNNVNTGDVIQIGNPTAAPPVILPCSLPNSNPWLSVNGLITSISANPINASLSMYTAPWNGSGYIEAEGTDNLGGLNTALLLNYFCGRDVLLCMNTGLSNGGGKVRVGNFLSATKHVEISNPTSPNSDPNNISLEISSVAGTGIKFNTYNNALPLISVNNSNFTNSPFTVLGDGRAYFGAKRVQSNHLHANSEFQFHGKIACKELVVIDPTKWADFVFDKNYELLPLNEVEAYYTKYKHLKDVPSEKEVKENGINSAEMDATLLQKIEELYLHMVQQNKRIEKLEAENKLLKQTK